jgi:hypothetical protein
MLKQKSWSIVNISTTLVGQPIAGVSAAVQIMVKGGLDAVTGALAGQWIGRVRERDAQILKTQPIM